ncbi:hypothetical protein [Paraburkholderia sp. BR10954]|uniref:hypothetical protein n=1 Tax=Paraburkholderia sp. BR10954 TaxID=3236995 RepID=UPI0034D27F1F
MTRGTNHLADQAQQCASANCRFNFLGQPPAILEVDHSSSTLSVLKIAQTFFESTSSAAASAQRLLLAPQFAFEFEFLDATLIELCLLLAGTASSSSVSA